LPGTGSPIVRRRELGTLLRGLRSSKGWTVEQVAERLLCSPSKVSRMETGQRGVSQRDIRDLCDLYGVDDEQRQRLASLAAAGKEQGWWQVRGLSYPTYIGLEAEAAAIHDVGLGAIPGLLQTADYARAVLETFRPPLGAEVIEQRLATRLDRQRILVSARPPLFEAVLEEGVLHRVVGSRATMRAQLERLLSASELPNVTISVVPYQAGALPVNYSKFIILRFAQPDLTGVVFIEGLTGNLYLDRPDEVEAYSDTLSALRDMAETGDHARGRIAAIASTFDD